MQFFVDFDTRNGVDGQDHDEQEFLFSSIFQGVHAAIVQECGESASNQNKMAISFPLSDEKNHGGLIRVLSSDEDVLGRMLRHSNIHRYTVDLDISILKIPAVNNFCIFFRNRINDRVSPSALRRAEIRLKTKSFPIKHVDKNADGFAIYIKSESNGNQFLFKICRKDAVQHLDDSFNSYGLSSKASVPMF